MPKVTHVLRVTKVKGRERYDCSCGHSLGFLLKEQAQDAHEDHYVIAETNALLCVAWFVGITWGIPGVIDGR